MRKIVSFGLVLAAVLAFSSPVFAVDKCHIPPPAWWNAPKVSYTYSGSSYASSHPSSSYGTSSHTFSAQRRSETRYIPWSSRYRDPSGRW
jgi:hypothetical protein